MDKDYFKLADKDEGILDTLIRPLAVKVADISESKGITPNQVTIFRSVLGLLALYFLFHRILSMWSFLYLTNYFLDCVDGIQARKYNRISRLGDILDHVSDVGIAGGAFTILIYEYNLLSNYLLTLSTLLFAFLFMTQTARQQEKCRKDPKKQSGSLDVLCTLYKHLTPIIPPHRITKNFSAAFFALWITLLPYLK